MLNGKNTPYDTVRRSDLELETENQGLEREIESKGGFTMKSEDCPPEIHNQFLKRILAFEELSEQHPLKRAAAQVFCWDSEAGRFGGRPLTRSARSHRDP